MLVYNARIFLSYRGILTEPLIESQYSFSSGYKKREGLFVSRYLNLIPCFEEAGIYFLDEKEVSTTIPSIKRGRILLDEKEDLVTLQFLEVLLEWGSRFPKGKWIVEVDDTSEVRKEEIDPRAVKWTEPYIKRYGMTPNQMRRFYQSRRKIQEKEKPTSQEDICRLANLDNLGVHHGNGDNWCLGDD